MEMLKLKNGSEEGAPVVRVLMMSLEKLLKEQPMVLYDAVMVARPGDYKPFGVNGKVLEDLSIIKPDGSMHDSVRNIILSAVEGEGLEMTLGNAVAGA